MRHGRFTIIADRGQIAFIAQKAGRLACYTLGSYPALDARLFIADQLNFKRYQILKA